MAAAAGRASPPTTAVGASGRGRRAAAAAQAEEQTQDEALALSGLLNGAGAAPLQQERSWENEPPWAANGEGGGGGDGKGEDGLALRKLARGVRLGAARAPADAAETPFARWDRFKRLHAAVLRNPVQIKAVVAWLERSGVSPFVERVNRPLLAHARGLLDAWRVLRAFKAWRAEHAARRELKRRVLHALSARAVARRSKLRVLAACEQYRWQRAQRAVLERLLVKLRVCAARTRRAALVRAALERGCKARALASLAVHARARALARQVARVAKSAQLRRALRALALQRQLALRLQRVTDVLSSMRARRAFRGWVAAVDSARAAHVRDGLLDGWLLARALQRWRRATQLRARVRQGAQDRRLAAGVLAAWRYLTREGKELERRAAALGDARTCRAALRIWRAAAARGAALLAARDVWVRWSAAVEEGRRVWLGFSMWRRRQLGAALLVLRARARRGAHDHSASTGFRELSGRWHATAVLRRWVAALAAERAGHAVAARRRVATLRAVLLGVWRPAAALARRGRLIATRGWLARWTRAVAEQRCERTWLARAAATHRAAALARALARLERWRRARARPRAARLLLRACGLPLPAWRARALRGALAALRHRAWSQPRGRAAAAEADLRVKRGALAGLRAHAARARARRGRGRGR
jgi:hypothetical protein